jgi:hypothetical protein
MPVPATNEEASIGEPFRVARQKKVGLTSNEQ